MKKFLYKLERVVSRIAIDNLMLAVIGAMAIVYVAGMIYPELAQYLAFDRAAILSGQVWRVITFVFIYSGTPIYMILFAYFYWWVGTTLEESWGKTKFCTYYYVGVLALIAAGFICGYSTAEYLNLSLFFAFAMLAPDQEVLLFFFIPVKVKWLAWIDAAYFLYMFIIGGARIRIIIAATLLNFFLFFYDDFIRRVKLAIQDAKWRRNNRNNGNGHWR